MLRSPSVSTTRKCTAPQWHAASSSRRSSKSEGVTTAFLSHKLSARIRRHSAWFCGASDGRAVRQQLGIGCSTQCSQPALFRVPNLPFVLPQAPKQALLARNAATLAWQLSLPCAAMPRLGADWGLEPSAAPTGAAGVVVSPSATALVLPPTVVGGTPLKPVARLGLGTATSFTTRGSVESGRSPKWTLPLLSFQRYTSERAPLLPDASAIASEKQTQRETHMLTTGEVTSHEHRTTGTKVRRAQLGVTEAGTGPKQASRIDGSGPSRSDRAWPGEVTHRPRWARPRWTKVCG